jgi:hypothetical protein
VPRLLRTLFADLYPVRKLLLDHHELLKPAGFSESVRMDVSVSCRLHPHRSTPHLWRGMILEAKRDLRGAARAYADAKRLSPPYDWQAAFRLWRVQLELADAEAARREREHLVRLWGEVQLAWYSPDVGGDVVPYREVAGIEADELRGV